MHIIMYYYSVINPNLKDASFIGFSCAYRTVIRLEYIVSTIRYDILKGG